MINDYLIEDVIYEDSKKTVYSANKDGKKFIIKQLTGMDISENKIKELQYEYEVLKMLNIKGVINPIEIIKNNLQYALVAEAFIGENLNELDYKNMDIKEKIKLMYKVVEIIGEIHSRNVIHKNITPFSIVYRLEDKEVRIVEFGDAAILSREKIVIPKYNLKDREVRYISPELTGRTNRAIDYRTDYYSLGAVFYEIFSGEKLFKEAESTIEIIYSHVAKYPKSVHEINREVPVVISNLIMKLLGKNCEERYQSIEGIKSDLNKILNEIEEKGDITEFEVGKNDSRESINLNEIKDVRNKEKKLILEKYNNVKNGNFEIISISGKSGMGKSSLIKEIEYECLKTGGIAAIGRFDKHKRGIPYNGISEALRNIVKYFLTESEEKVFEIKNEILKNIGENGKIITEIIPEIEYIIGKQEILEELSPIENLNRFNFTLINFLISVSKREVPLILCLDECNMADIASIEFLKRISERKNIGNIMIVLISTEDSEESVDDFEFIMNEIEKNIKITKIKLEKLDINGIKEILIGMLSENIENFEKLSENIEKITDGIPLYIKQYLEIMYKRKIIYFDRKNLKWIWNENELISLETGKDLSNLILTKIRECSKNCEILLRRAAIIGREFSYKRILKLTGFDNEKVTMCLWEAMQEKIIEPIDFDNETQRFENSNPKFKFTNDRFFHVLYSNIEDKLRQAIHEKYGNIILDEINKEENIFEIVYHLNISKEGINEKNKQKELAELNYMAGNKAKKSSAFKAALKYYIIADEVFGAIKDNEDEEFKSKLYSCCAEAAYSCAEYDLMDKYCSYIINSNISEIEKTNVYVVKILSFLAKGDSKGAVEFALEKLKNYKIFISPKSSSLKVLSELLKIKVKLMFKDAKKLSELPKMNDEIAKSAMRILTTVSSSAYLSYPEVFVLIVIKEIELSLKYGNSIESPFAYSMYGVLLCGVLDDIEKGYGYGKSATEILKRFNNNEYTGKSSTVANLFVLHWRDKIDSVIENFKKSHKDAIAFGDVEYAAWALLCEGFYSFFAGENLKILKEKLLSYGGIVKKDYKQEKQYQTIEEFIEIVNWLMYGEVYSDEEKIKDYLKNGESNGLYYIFFRKMLMAVYLKDYKKGIIYSEKAELYLKNVTSTLNIPEFYFLSALCYIKEYKSISKHQKIKLNKMYKKIKKYSRINPETHLNKHLILRAEKGRLYNNIKTPEYFENAIQNSLKNKFIQYTALANELAGEYYIERDMKNIGEFYTKEAYIMYKKWGADKICNRMLEQYHYLKNISTEIKQNNENNSELIDTIGMIKISQLLSSEVKYDSLINKLIEIVMENAGAEKCKIFIRDREELVLEAESDINKKTVNSNINKKYSEMKDEIPESIINYVYRTGESVLIENAQSETRYNNDRYIINIKPKSILCIPIIVQNKCSGIMYFENNLIRGAFQSERVEMLKMIASQSGISLENIKIYEKLEEKVNERTEELRKTNKKLEESNTELIEAKNIANRAAKLKAEFLANMSHEIRTPMNGIIGLTHLIKNTNLNQIQEGYVEKIEESSKHLLGIINDILDFSKLEAGKIKIDKEKFSIEKVLSYISAIIGKTCEDKKVELFIKIGEEIPRVVAGDEMRLKQVLTNLAGNAAKFTQSGEIIVSAEKVNETENKIAVKFTVKDTGIGMTTEEKKKLFQAFTQADGSISRKFGGTGLGLVISKNLVELMGGKIEVESHPGEGSCFNFEIEFEKVVSDEAEKEYIFGFEDIKVLIIDDSEISLEIIEEYLKGLNMRTDKALSGKEGIEKIKSNSYDLIIIDWKMPEISGIETIKIIKENIAMEEPLSIIMVSAYNIDEIKEEGKKVGINGFLTKPVQKSALYENIHKILNESKNNKEMLKKEEKNVKEFNYEKVLVVEDNKINQLVAAEFLNSFKIDVTIAESGQQAIEFAKNNKYSLILMDVQMPEMDGYEATKRIKFENGSVPIIAMTANSMDGDKEKCLAAGMDDYISKPISPEKLNRTLLKWIKSNKEENKIDKREDTEELTELQGIDTGIDIIRISGKDVYLEILKEFCNEYKNMEEDLQKMYRNLEYENMRKYLHSLKSAAGNVGAKKLSDYTIKLEELVIKQERNMEKELETVISEFKKVLSNKII